MIRIKGDCFVDHEGNQILFNGVNYVCKDPGQGYLFPAPERVFRRFREQGFNLIRLGIFWDGVEPQPGVYDHDYLQRVKDVIELARQNGLYVMLDMHQDLFSRKWGDGAPLWATLDEGAPHPESCTMWYDAYLQSEAIIRAADNFWENAPAADGVGLGVDVSDVMRAYQEQDVLRILFGEVPGAVIQIQDADFDYLDAELLLQDVAFFPLGHPVPGSDEVRVKASAKSGIQTILESLMQNAEGED
jgi:hypothetical protein